jgi:hypothetical protein
MATRAWVAITAIGLLAPSRAARGQDKPQPPKAGAPAAKGDEKSTGKVGETLPEWKGKVARGDKSADFSTTKNGKTTVYVLVGASDPASSQYAERLVALSAAYAARGVDFVLVYSGSEPAASKQKFHKEKHFSAALLDDEGGAFAKSLVADHYGLALIADKDGKVVYRGGIDDNLALAKVKSKHLQQALELLLKGQPVAGATNKDVFGGSIK